MISFVFYTCSARIDNLTQTVRILQNREKYLNKEIIIVYQDGGPELPNTITFNLGMDTYQKPKMCNFGVYSAKNSIVALLDSDRILPYNYFENISNIIKKNDFHTSETIMVVDKEISDNQIENFNFDYFTESRSKSDELVMKNMFSGNTVFLKDDYFLLGGMDESFIGYGYADTDMTKKAMNKKMKFHFHKINEIHLYHSKEIFYRGEILKDFKILSAINILKYCLKWKIKDEKITTVCNEVLKRMDFYPTDLQNEFKKMYKKLNSNFLI